jgi:hypothetical protein
MRHQLSTIRLNPHPDRQRPFDTGVLSQEKAIRPHIFPINNIVGHYDHRPIQGQPSNTRDNHASLKLAMKKTFRLTKGNHAPARVIDGIKADIRKYVKRERGKELPNGIDFWDFDCKVGPAAETAAAVHLSDIGKAVDDAAKLSTTESIYVEILASGKRRNPPIAKPKPKPTPPPKTNSKADSKPTSKKSADESPGTSAKSALHERREKNAPPQLKPGS